MKAPHSVPVRIGPYNVVRRMAAGGMSEILLAHRYGARGYERSVIIKVLRMDWAESEDSAHDFLREARLASTLDHPHIVKVLEVGETGQGPFLVMEYVFGQSLRQVLDRSHQVGLCLDNRHIRTIVADALSALAYAHGDQDPRQSLIHRDVSPSNLLIGFDGVVRLLDFGLAKNTDEASATRAGVIKGKFGYMSPEQVRKGPLDRRSDLFSLGTILWELLCQRSLFASPNDMETVEKILAGPIPFPRSLNKEAAWDLSWAAWRALRKYRALRYPTATKMHRAIGSSSPIEEDRDHLQSFMQKLYFVELNARDLALQRSRDDPTFFRKLRDSGFELLPEVTDPSIPSLKRGITHLTGPLPAQSSPATQRRPNVMLLPGILLLALGCLVWLTRTVSRETQAGYIQIVGQPGVPVWLDSELAGPSPIGRLQVPPGKHQVQWGTHQEGSLDIEVRPGSTLLVRLRPVTSTSPLSSDAPTPKP